MEEVIFYLKVMPILVLFSYTNNNMFTLFYSVNKKDVAEKEGVYFNPPPQIKIHLSIFHEYK